MSLDAFIFGGTDFSPFFVVSKTTVPFLHRENTYQQAPGLSSGARLLHTKNLKNMVSLEGTIISDHSKVSVVEAKNKMVVELNRAGTQQLVLPQFPDKYFNATYEGTVDYNANDSGYSEAITLVFDVPDGVAHSLKSIRITAKSGEPVTVPNAGTAPTAPILQATMTSENGLVSFINSKGGVLQFGDPEEQDKVSGVKADKVVDDGMRPGQTSYTYNTGGTTYNAYVGNGKPNKKQGSITYSGECAIPSYVSDSVVYWHGPTMHRSIPANSVGTNNGAFIARVRFNFNTDVASMGHLEINLTNGDKSVAMFTMRDSTVSANQIITSYMLNGRAVRPDIAMNPKLFGNGFYEMTLTKWGTSGSFKLSKVQSLNGESVVPGSTYLVPFSDDIFATTPIDGATFWFQKFSNKKVVNMNVSDFKFHWTNVPYVTDIPNRFDNGDVLTADVANKAIYLNGALDNTLHTVGNDWDSFLLDPGDNTIETVVSSWATPADTLITFKEAWL